MPPDPLDRLTDYAQSLLDAVVIILGTTDAGAPASQFLTPAAPAFDCEFVAVQVALLSEESTSPLSPLMATGNRNRFGNIILVSYDVYVVRCGPEIIGGQPPSDAAKTASAALVQQDGWALWNGLREVQDTLFDDCIGAYFDGGAPIEESGGFIGWAFSMRAAIEGYAP